MVKILYDDRVVHGISRQARVDDTGTGCFSLVLGGIALSR